VALERGWRSLGEAAAVDNVSAPKLLMFTIAPGFFCAAISHAAGREQRCS